MEGVRADEGRKEFARRVLCGVSPSGEQVCHRGPRSQRRRPRMGESGVVREVTDPAGVVHVLTQSHPGFLLPLL